MSPTGNDRASIQRWFGPLWLIFACMICRPLRAAPPALHVGSITIRTDDVYSDEETSRGSLFRLADKLHVETRPEVIRKFLLFHEGDVYEPARLLETERNLRALGFIRSVSIVSELPHDGVVDVVVETADAWSLQPGTNAGSRGGVSTFGFDLTDSNIGGTGASASVSYDQGVDRSRMAFDLNDPAFVRPYLRARATYARNSDGFEQRLAIGQPFYSIATRRSANFSYVSFRRDDRLYQSGRISSVLSRDHRELNASWAAAIRAGPDSATRLGLGFRMVDDRFRDGFGSMRPPRSFRYLVLNLSRAESRFVTWNFVDEDLRFQDFNLGKEFSLEAAVSPQAAGVERTSEFVRAIVSRGDVWGDRAFFVTRASFESRLDHGLQNSIGSLSERFVRRWETKIPQTFVARLLINEGKNLDPEIQYAADGRSGLRGYRLHAFEGSGNLIFNVEQRVFLGHELLQFVSPGAVAFFDAGKASDHSLFSTAGLKSDIGVGIRLGLPRTQGNLIRIDIAFPLQRDPLGRRGPIISFSSSQAF